MITLTRRSGRARYVQRGRWRLTERRYEGTVGNRRHITLVEEGTIPTRTLTHLEGVMGEVRHAHRNRHGAEWQAFVEDIREHGIREPILITVDPGEPPKLSEGNHRLDAALEAGLPEVPVEIRYFGHAERAGTVLDRSR